VHSFKFVDFDDGEYVFENPNIQAGITLKSVKWAFTAGYAGNWHPLTWLSHAIDWQLFGDNAGGHHIINLIFHIANTLLLFIVLKQMTGILWPSAFVAALFALHPLHVESVAWVSERKDVLSALFWLLTMWAYLCYVKKRSISRYLWIVSFLVLGLMAKPMLVTLPFVLLLLDYWPLNRFKSPTSRGLWLQLLIEKIPLFLIVIASSVVTYLVQQKGGTFTVMPLKFRILNALASYAEYIEKMIWPSGLAYFYPHPGPDVSIPYTVFSVLFLSAVTVVIFRFGKNRRYLLTGWLWFIGTLVPVIGLVQVGTQAMADRYSYITLTGLFIIIAWGLPELFGRRKVALAAFSATILFALALCTYIQTQYWKDSYSLFQHALKATDNNYKAHLGLAGVFLKEGDVNEANHHIWEAVRIKPDFTETLNDLGTHLYKTGQLDEAIDSYKMALEINPADVEVNANIGVALATKGDFARAVRHYRIAVKRINTPAIHNNLGYALANTGKLDEAIEQFMLALQINPEYKPAKANLDIFLAEKRKLENEISEDTKK